MFESNPISTTCPECDAKITTRTSNGPSNATHALACILCIFCFPIAWLPYCTNYKNSTNHYCPECNAQIGTYIPPEAPSGFLCYESPDSCCFYGCSCFDCCEGNENDNNNCCCDCDGDCDCTGVDCGDCCGGFDCSF